MIPAQKQPNSILPDILEVASQHNVHLGKPVSGRPGEIRAQCPFCLSNLGKADKHFHLYLNSHKGTFKCQRCNEKGGVIKFIAVLNGTTENYVLEEIKSNYRNENSGRIRRPIKKKHPALTLNYYQLKELGIGGKLNWSDLKDDPAGQKLVADYIWQKWLNFLEYEKMQAVKIIYLYVKSSTTGYSKAIEYIRLRSKEIGFDLLTPVLEEYGSSKPPEWVKEGIHLAKLWLGEEK
jgi:hypothetical protein